MDHSVWVELADEVPRALRAEIDASLAAARVRPSATKAGEGCGIVVLGGAGASALQSLQRACGGKSTLVLAIVVGRTAADQADPWSLLQAGATDVLLWPEVPPRSDAVRERLERWRTLHDIGNSPQVCETLVGTSTAWRALRREVVELALFATGPVLIQGESGTGKELVARLIHELDPRPTQRELVTVDCTTITPDLAGSELFGHERGAFTGALAARDGAFALAHGGTLFLDEIGELPLPLQAQLLRVVQEGRYKRVGSNVWQHARFRLVAATHRDLQAGVAAGSFRADLYHRIAGSICRTPALRDRPEDVLALAHHFQAALEGGEGGRAQGFDDAVARYLQRREYPGNARELQRVVGRLCHRHAGSGPVTVGAVCTEERPSPAQLPAAPVAPHEALEARFAAAAREAIGLGLGLKEIAQSAAESAIRLAIEQERGNLHRAALRLGVTDRALQLRRAQRRGNGSAAS
jgi:transcriptional regulator with GAF, ATPase, and Fis domain